MAPCFTVQRSILLAGTVAGILLAAPAFAQQPSAPASPPAAAPAAPLPPGSPLIGRPEGNPAAAKLAPVAPPAIAGGRRQAADREAQTAAGFQHRSLRQRNCQYAIAARRRQGHRVRRHAPRQQGHRNRQEGRQDRDQDDRRGPLSPERARLPQRHALHRRAFADLQDRQHRGQSSTSRRSRR